MSFSILLCSSLIFLCLIHIYRDLNRICNYWKQRGVKGPIALPILGNLIDLIITPLNVLQVKYSHKYGGVYGHMILSQPVLTIADPELIRQIAIKDFSFFNYRLNLFAGDELLSITLPFLNGNHWKRVRNIISPSFSTGKIRKMFPLVNECVKNTLKHISKISNNNQEVELKKLMTSFTMDVTAKCVFSIHTDSYENPENQFLCNAYEFLRFRVWRVLFVALLPMKVKKFFNIQLIPGYLIEYFTNIINFIIEERRKSDGQYNDFIKLMIDAEYHEDFLENDLKLENDCKNRKLDTSEIIAQSIAFFTGGYETSATLLNFCIYSLSLNQKVQQKLYEDLSYIFPGDIDDYDKLNGLIYLDAVINETLRNFTPVSSFDRLASEDYLLEDRNMLIEKGTLITIAYYAIHHNPDYFPDPYSFKPERFLPENRNQIKPYTFMPFGVGPRNCVGMRFALLQEKIFIANLVKNYKVFATKNTPQKPNFTGRMFILTSEPLYVTFERR